MEMPLLTLLCVILTDISAVFFNQPVVICDSERISETKIHTPNRNDQSKENYDIEKTTGA
jgi:hypothetical protein